MLAVRDKRKDKRNLTNTAKELILQIAPKFDLQKTPGPYLVTQVKTKLVKFGGCTPELVKYIKKKWI